MSEESQTQVLRSIRSKLELIASLLMIVVALLAFLAFIR